jgi:hypothetical protein
VTTWVAEGGHTEGLDRQPAEWERRVVGFLGAALLVPDAGADRAPAAGSEPTA